MDGWMDGWDSVAVSWVSAVSIKSICVAWVGELLGRSLLDLERFIVPAGVAW